MANDRHRGVCRALNVVWAACATALTVACSGQGASNTGDPGSNAGLAETWAVSIDNATGTCFKPDAGVELVVTATDGDGDAIANPSYTVSAEPSDGLESDGSGGLVVRGEGPLELTVEYTGPRIPQASIAPQTLQLMRDGTLPTITVTAPLRGTMRQTVSNDESVDIVGDVTDALSPVKVVVVNEEVLTIGGDNLSESIAVSRAAKWGINVVRVEAADACGNTARHAQSFLQSDTYLAPAVTKSTAARVPNASVVRAAQAAFDDSNRDDFDDFATVAERYLQNNLVGILNGVVNAIPTQSADVLSCTFSADPLTPISMDSGSPTLETQLANGSFDFRYLIKNLRIPVRYREICRGPFGGVLSDISATFGHRVATLNTVMTVRPRVVGRQLDPSITANTAVSGVTLDSSTNPVLADAMNLALPLFSAGIESTLEGVIDSTLADLADDIVGEMLGQLTQVFPIDFPPPIDLSLAVAGDWTSIDTTAAAITMELGQYVYAPVVGTPHAAGIGAIHGGFATRSLASLPGPLAYGLNDDGMNQILWAAWHGGGLELDDLQSYAALVPDIAPDLGGLTLHASGLLPPVIEGATLPGQVRLGIGDVHIDGSVDLSANATLAGSGIVTFDLFAGIVTDGRSGFDIAGNALNLRLGDPSSQFYLQIDELTVDGFELTPTQAAEVRAYLIEVVQPLLRQLATDLGAQLQLPQFRLEFPEETFGPQSGFILDIVLLKRDIDRFIASVDPDDAFAPPVAVVDDWDALADAAIVAARTEAAGWLQGAEVGCTISSSNASGWAVRTNAYDVSDGVKRALLAAGAPETVAREWNRIFKAAWLGWGDLLRIPKLPWFPAFAGNFPSGVPQQSPASTGPIGTLQSPGENLMSAAALSTELQFRLQDYLDQIGATPALDRFAADMEDRLAALRQDGTIDDVVGIAVYPDFALYAIVVGVMLINKDPFEAATNIIEFVIEFWPPPPPRGPVIGACQRDGHFSQSAF